MRKKFVALFVTLILIASMASPAQASWEPKQTNIQPIYTGVVLVAVDISISEQGYATVYSDILVKPNYRIDGTLQLRRDSGFIVGSWNISGTLSLSFNHSMYVTTGHEYYTFVSIDVYDNSNNKVDHIEVSSKPCPF